VRLSPRTLGRWFSSPDLFESSCVPYYGLRRTLYTLLYSAPVNVVFGFGPTLTSSVNNGEARSAERVPHVNLWTYRYRNDAALYDSSA